MNKDYKMARFVNLNNKWVPYTSQEELLELYSKEIDRLNNIISELEKYIEEKDVYKLLEIKLKELKKKE